MKPSTQAAMWRIAYRLEDNEQDAEAVPSIKSAINVDGDVLDEALATLKEIGVITFINGAGYKLVKRDWGDFLLKTLPPVEPIVPEDSDTYLYRIAFGGRLGEMDTSGPKSESELNEVLTAIRTRTPLQPGDRLSLESATWKVADIFHEFAYESVYDEEYPFPFPAYSEGENFVEEEVGPIVRVVRADRTL